MKKADVVILGGLSGISAGISCRRHYPDKKIVLIRKENTVLVPCGIPYIYGTVGGPENNVVPDGLLERNNIELLKGEATQVDREKKLVHLKNGESVNYDKLVFATGSTPLIPPIKGVDKKGVFPVKKEFDYLNDVLKTVNNVKDLVIIGGGFIGVEFADECRKGRDINITLIEALPKCLQMAMDNEFCEEAEEKLKEAGVNVLTNEKVVEFIGGDCVEKVKLESGKEIKAEAVILGIGAVPNTKLAEESGLALGFRKTIKVDARMQTMTDPDVFACGDCAEKKSFFDNRPSGVMLASIATSEARIAGANLFSPSYKNVGTISVFSTMINGKAFAVAGMTERSIKQAGMEYIKTEAESADTHPAGMPNSTLMYVKLLFCKNSSALIGAAISGGKSVGEMINVVSACITNEMKSDDIVRFQMGTHPALTSSPIMYPLVNAACKAISPLKSL